MTTITYESLQHMEACRGQLGLFNHTFPNGMELTRQNLLHAAQVGLDLEWWAIRFNELYPYLSTYFTFRGRAWSDYEAACEPHNLAYNTARSNRHNLSEEEFDSHERAYEDACKLYRSIYATECASTIASLLRLEQWREQS